MSIEIPGLIFNNKQTVKLQTKANNVSGIYYFITKLAKAKINQKNYVYKQTLGNPNLPYETKSNISLYD